MNWVANYLIKQASMGGLARRLRGGTQLPPQPQPNPPPPGVGGPIGQAYGIGRAAAGGTAVPKPMAAGQPSTEKPSLWGPGKNMPSPLSSPMATTGAGSVLAKRLMPDGSHIQNVQQPNIRTTLAPMPAR